MNERHTEDLFINGVLYARDDEIYKPKDIEEMRGHFMMFNYMLDTLSEPLNEAIIKGLHKQLKQGVFEDIANGYNIGEYKGRANRVARITTALPVEVPEMMQNLVNWYRAQECVTIKTLAQFHARYESIHPFQDGNGRTGRIILFRECLKYNIVPFIIVDSKRAMYMRGLEETNSAQDYTTLCKLFEEMQELFYEETKDMLMESDERD